MNFPQDLKYAKSHEWLRIDGSNGTIGISDYAQSELGDVVFVDISVSVGDELNAGDVFGTIEAVKTVSDLYIPVGGKITAINAKLTDEPETMNSDPYGDGWLIKLELANAEASEMMDAAAYEEMVGAGH